MLGPDGWFHMGRKWMAYCASQPLERLSLGLKGGGTLLGEVHLAPPDQRGDVFILPVARQGKTMQLRLNADTLVPANAPLPASSGTKALGEVW
ncbi:hypothetical protein [Sphingobium sp.]|uniref:hypothetical protein n=1 Tax=Sphingobium TaxID=165695 RepID=UPI001A355C4C|nr:hypothetical protein [Sphingobium sp.]MBJ7376859.1 hypothetical protein [Sphingobium sp.]